MVKRASCWEAVEKRTEAYLPSMVSSCDGGLWSGVELIYFTSPTEKAENSCESTFSGSWLAPAAVKSKLTGSGAACLTGSGSGIYFSSVTSSVSSPASFLDFFFLAKNL